MRFPRTSVNHRLSAQATTLLLPALRATLPAALLLILACGAPASDDTATTAAVPAPTGDNMLDVHSYAKPDEAVVRHLDLDLAVDFEARKISGRASLTIDTSAGATQLHLDSRGLDIAAVFLDDASEPTTFALGEDVPLLGSELTIEIEPTTQVVHVDYATQPQAAAVQWLDPAQTAGGQHPFLFTQGQAILTRTWVPCQDSPGVRVTYSAKVQVPPALVAVMSAENQIERAPDGIYTFDMPQAVPPYLLALAVGDLEFRSLGPRSGVFAEPSVVEKAAYEFGETEEMMAAVERLYGPYRWGRYDILVLPPSFPFGGMENPRLTFATPTILAGDRSLVALIAHELAHSWSGNLVTNATWNDFWLNEGFTVYLERRIMEELNGPEYAAMLTLLGLQDLQGQIEDLGATSRDTHLYLDLAGRDPDEGMTDIAYEKGYFFLRMLEEAVGRERWDSFLKAYFDRNAFQSLTTAGFIEQLRADLLAGDADLTATVRLDDWIYGAGLPSNVPAIESPAFVKVEAQVDSWAGGAAADSLAADEWTTHEWLHFLRSLPAELDKTQMQELDTAFEFSGSGNSEVLHAWLHHVIANGYEPAYPALEAFLTGMGRRKFLQPLYERLAKTEEGLAMARRIYTVARPSYHSISTTTIDEILNWDAAS